MARSRAKASEPAEPPRFEDALARLEAVVDELEGGELDLEQALVRFEEGVRLSRQCATQLDAAKRRIDVLVNENGELSEERLDLEAGDAEA